MIDTSSQTIRQAQTYRLADVEIIVKDPTSGKSITVAGVPHAKSVLEQLPKNRCLASLKNFIALADEDSPQLSSQNDQLFSTAINQAMDLGLTSHPTYLQALEVFRERKHYPSNWDVAKIIGRAVWKPEVSDARLLRVFQALVDGTFVKK